MNVMILGAGLMGAQIGCEYAMGGHDVTLVARDAEAATRRFEAALADLADLGLAGEEGITEARARMRAAASAHDWDGGFDLIVESLPEDLELKVELLRVAAESSPACILATNTSSLSVSAIGRLAGLPWRTLGTHYWNPPLLMPLVEVIPGGETDTGVVELVASTLKELGKQPVRCRDVPGFAWNRLQIAVLREVIWLLENGATTPDEIDAILSDGLARRWRNIGFFDAIALGGVDTWERAAKNLLPQLSSATAIHHLGAWVEVDKHTLAATARTRDRGLARELLGERTPL
jgi:3-hydroxybutyryl-CoA dehydrogenase